ncbi:MAG: glycosyltransferase [Candidatus Marinimicrobia bacterium]|nr:glycosyltransferase [Candidatus Neomarinimicrobiota bacterium]
MRVMIATAGHSPDDDDLFHRMTRSLLDAGHRVLMVTRGQTATAPELDGFQHVNFPDQPVTDFGRALEQLAREWQPEALQVREFELLAAAGRIRKAHGIPVIYNVGDHHREMYATFSSKPPVIKQLINWGLVRFERTLLKHADVVTAASTTIEERYRSWGCKTVPVFNYPRHRDMETDTDKEPLVIYHGQLSIERGVGTLVNAFVEVIRRRPEARLEIYGSERVPGTLSQLREAVRQSGLEGSITVSPAIARQQVLARLGKAAIGVIPFHNKPLFRVAPPNKLYEYYACWCAVVCSDLPVLRVIARDAARFVPPGDAPALADAISSLLSDDQDRLQLARRGRELVENEYRWDLVEDNYLNIFREPA